MLQPPDDTEHPEISKREAHKGGNMLIAKLLALAVPTSDSQQNVPTHYKDIVRLPVQQQLQWRAACREELEALQKRQVYELVNLPLNRKAIRNRWVLNQKMDGQKGPDSWPKVIHKLKVSITQRYSLL